VSAKGKTYNLRLHKKVWKLPEGVVESDFADKADSPDSPL
jgi:hypothetical protein